MTPAIRARLTRLQRLPQDPAEADLLLQEARDVLGLLKATEARQVSEALRDPRFPFGSIQQELGRVRASFAVSARGLARARPYAASQRRELLETAQLVEQAPLTTVEDLAAIRAARSERPASVS